mgnify:CR=1 FL=1
MLVAQIKTDKRIYSLYSDNIDDNSSDSITIYGHYFENNKFYPLNNEVFDEFRKLKLGKNYKKIDTITENNISYDVILDLDTNLKHYFNNGKENLKLFLNNFTPVTIALSKDNKDNKTNLKAIACAFSFLTCINSSFLLYHSISKQKISLDQPAQYQEVIDQLNDTPEFTIDIVKKVINSNPNLDEYDKNIILNEELLNFVIPYINMNEEYRAELYNFILPNLTIEKRDIELKEVIGLRGYDIIVLDTNKINESKLYVDTLTHEFTHLLQPFSTHYSFIYEGVTEMLSNEFSYLKKDPNNAYSENQKYIAILMEIIGTEPVLEYCFTNNENCIKEKLKPYLIDEHLNELLECFKVKHKETDYNRINDLLNEAFYNKYGLQIQESILTNMYLNDPYNFKFFNNPTNGINLKNIALTSRKYIFDGEKFVEMPVTEYAFIIEQARSDNNNELNDGIIYVPKDVLLTSTSLEQAVNLVQSKTK